MDISIDPNIKQRVHNELINSLNSKFKKQPCLFKKKRFNDPSIITNKNNKKPKNIALVEYDQEFYENKIATKNEIVLTNCVNSLKDLNSTLEPNLIKINDQKNFSELQEIKEENSMLMGNSCQLSNNYSESNIISENIPKSK